MQTHSVFFPRVMGSLGKVFGHCRKAEWLLILCRPKPCHSFGKSPGIRHCHLLVQRKVSLDCRTMYSASKIRDRHQHVEQRRAVYNHYMSPDVLPIGLAIQTLDTVHSTLGIPWWLTIAITTITLRTVVTLPAHIYSMRNQAKLNHLSVIFSEMAKILAQDIKRAEQMKQYQHWDEREKQRQFKINMRKIVKKEQEKHNVHPAKSVVVAVLQIPLWISMSLALRNMSGSIPVTGMELPVMYPDLATQGLLWFPDLLVPDATFLIPIIMTLSNLIIIEMFTLKASPLPRGHKIVSYAMRFLVLCIMPPVAASVPSCISFYWTCSSLYGFIQNIVLRLPKVKRALRMPKVHDESETPLRDMWSIAKKKYSIRNKLEKIMKTEGKE